MITYIYVYTYMYIYVQVWRENVFVTRDAFMDVA